MKETLKKAGIFTLCGVLFGGMAGVSFTGAKYGVEYIAQQYTQQEVKNPLTEIKNTKVEGVAHTNKENGMTVEALVQEVMPSIVSITSTTVYQNPYAFFFGGDMNQVQTGAGSGVVIKEEEEYLLIATNNHVVENTEEITVGFYDGTDVKATVRGTSPSNDLAVVEIKKEELSQETLKGIKIASMGAPEDVQVGEQVVAIGNALGYGQSVTVGYISALNRSVTIDNRTISMLQTDAAINQGNSGGALFNMQGELVGINSAKAANYSGNVEGMGYAIPVSIAQSVLDGLMQGKDVQTLSEGSAYIGIQGRNLSEQEAKSFNMPQGIYLLSIVAGSPGEAAGLRPGDIVVGVDDINVQTMEEIQGVIRGKNPGDVVTISYYRLSGNGEYEKQKLDVELGSYMAE